jgi:hypothetical protein
MPFERRPRGPCESVCPRCPWPSARIAGGRTTTSQRARRDGVGRSRSRMPPRLRYASGDSFLGRRVGVSVAYATSVAAATMGIGIMRGGRVPAAGASSSSMPRPLGTRAAEEEAARAGCAPAKPPTKSESDSGGLSGWPGPGPGTGMSGTAWSANGEGLRRTEVVRWDMAGGCGGESRAVERIGGELEASAVYEGLCRGGHSVVVKVVEEEGGVYGSTGKSGEKLGAVRTASARELMGRGEEDGAPNGDSKHGLLNTREK